MQSTDLKIKNERFWNVFLLTPNRAGLQGQDWARMADFAHSHAAIKSAGGKSAGPINQTSPRGNQCNWTWKVGLKTRGRMNETGHGLIGGP